MLGLAALVILRNDGWRVPAWLNWGMFHSKGPANPEDTIYAMLDAARTGNVKAYLDVFSGPMHDQLRQVVNDSTESKFAAYLTTQNAAFQGVAVSMVDRSSDLQAEARVEYVFSNRNEIQDVYLKKERGQWRILQVAGAEQVKTLIPFGTAVTD
jgi:hypothetical protein